MSHFCNKPLFNFHRICNILFLYGRMAGGTLGGHIPSSVYLRSSYRAKQYPTLSTTRQQQPGPVRGVWGQQQQPDPRSPQHHHHHTLPTPYKNRFEANAGCDSPVGLYNCPQQRTSQAFSSLDDLDGLAGRILNFQSSGLSTRYLKKCKFSNL